ncbi:hypothetical protein [Mesorhizobium sp. B2-3-5]|uniref:hypothetical protein n=1 Tax=Mesorhizobium sp. B2-3-5 TaxID=2589958 RepID=UPI001FEF0D8A|nr:hypothetical protein [Mesorhizobium sp. B2-3-5]
MGREAAMIAVGAGKRDGGIGGIDSRCDPGHHPGPTVGVQNAIIDIADNRRKEFAAWSLHHASKHAPDPAAGGSCGVILSDDARRGRSRLKVQFDQLNARRPLLPVILTMESIAFDFF